MKVFPFRSVVKQFIFFNMTNMRYENKTITVKEMIHQFKKSERTIRSLIKKDDFPQPLLHCGKPKRWNRNEVNIFFNEKGIKNIMKLQDNTSYKCIATLEPTELFSAPETSFLEIFGISREKQEKNVVVTYLEADMINQEKMIKHNLIGINKQIDKMQDFKDCFCILKIKKDNWEFALIADKTSLKLEDNTLDLSDLELFGPYTYCNIFKTSITFIEEIR